MNIYIYIQNKVNESLICTEFKMFTIHKYTCAAAALRALHLYTHGKETVARIFNKILLNVSNLQVEREAAVKEDDDGDGDQEYAGVCGRNYHICIVRYFSHIYDII